jgi:hypothetical protein
MQGPPPQQPGTPEEDPRPEQPHPLDEPAGEPSDDDVGTDQQVGG